MSQGKPIPLGWRWLRSEGNIALARGDPVA
jgi:hypothetical protein